MIEVTKAQPFYATCEGFASGLTGTLGVRVVRHADASTTTTRTTSGIAEYPSGSGHYIATLTAPSNAGDYSVVWDTGSVTPSTVASEDMHVYERDTWQSLKPAVRGNA